MAARTHLLLALTTASSLCALAASAQQPPIVVEQLQWGDIFANMTVESASGASVAASTIAAGNSVSAAGLGADTDVTATQTFSGAAFATSEVSAGDACCEATSVASAQGNAIEAQTTNGDLAVTTSQLADGGDVMATARAAIGNTSLLSVVANAAANNIATSVENGDLDAAVVQDAAISVYAIADADACCAGAAVVGATATANAWSSDSYTSTVTADYVQSSSGPEVYASSDVFQVRGHDVTNAAAAAGNSAIVANEYGYAALRGRQDNDSRIRAEARTTLSTWQGEAASSAYGVGNATLATNVGSDLVVDIAQTNTGGVDALASFSGDPGSSGDAGSGDGAAVVGATAIGNAFTGYVCGYCGDSSVSGSVTQTNGGAIRATGVLTTNSAGAIVGAASAIGNSATFITTTPRP